MRVLLLFSSSQIGGAERSLVRMALATEGVDYRFATLDGEGPWCNWVRSQGRAPLMFGTPSWRRSPLLLAMFRLIRHLRRHPVDIVYVCGVRAAFLLRLLRIWLPGVKLVHGVRWNPASDSRLDRWTRRLERLTHPLVDAWITNAEITRQTLISRCGIAAGKVHVIHNGLEPPLEGPIPLTLRPMEVLTVSNLAPRKGHIEYLDVVRQVARAIPTARFVFVGRDDMNGAVQRAVIREGLSDYVQCVGFRSDVAPWLNRARIFVLPSLWNEGCPTSILEAMSFGIPCVAFAQDGIPELIENGQQGTLIEQINYPMMAKVIIELLVDDDKALKMGRSGRARVLSHFQLNNSARLHVEAFSKITS